MTSRERIQHLFELYYQDRISEEEEAELMEWIAHDPEAREQLPVLLEQHWETLTAADTAFNAVQGAPMLQQILGRKDQRVIPLRRYGWAAAAAILALVMAGGVLLWQTRRPATQEPIAKAAMPVVLPGGSKAELVLADGSKIKLDSAGNQEIKQGNTVARHQGGQLLYQAGAGDGMISYNTLVTRHGGQFRLTLPDGTNVWLNASSSITYPTAFTGKERQVNVSGEVYFEVAPKADQPFMVTVNGKETKIQVLGTQFNISAYDDNTAIATTLVQGSIRVASASGKSTVLKPGQQALTNGVQDLSVVNNADVDQAVAWKNGIFNFNGKDLTEVMRQLMRWYDIEVVYAGKVPQRKFGGEIQRTLPLAEVLEILEKMDIKFKLEANGKKLTVLPE